MTELYFPVAYLEAGDFRRNGAIVDGLLPQRKLMLLIQSGGCGHCERAKPAFQAIANELRGEADFATIQVDDPKVGNVARVQEIIKTIKPGFRGYPDYVMFVDGKPQQIDGPSGRSVEALKRWLHSV